MPDDTDAMLQLQKLEQVKIEVQSWISKVNPFEPDVSLRPLTSVAWMRVLTFYVPWLARHLC